MKKRVTIIVSGLVQGVFFRAFVKEKIEELGLVGWARNAPDGTVEVLAEGEEKKLKKLVGYCKEGPKFAKINKVEIRWEEALGQLNDFRIR